jgi:hypothetical protein
MCAARMKQRYSETEGTAKQGRKGGRTIQETQIEIWTKIKIQNERRLEITAGGQNPIK